MKSTWNGLTICHFTESVQWQDLAAEVLNAHISSTTTVFVVEEFFDGSSPEFMQNTHLWGVCVKADTINPNLFEVGVWVDGVATNPPRLLTKAGLLSLVMEEAAKVAARREMWRVGCKARWQYVLEDGRIVSGVENERELFVTSYNNGKFEQKVLEYGYSYDTLEWQLEEGGEFAPVPEARRITALFMQGRRI